MGRLILVSNRVADLTQSSQWGGLAVALSDALKPTGGIWFGWNGEIDPSGFTAAPEIRTAGNLTTVRFPLTQDDYDQYYLGYCNSVLWPIFHYRLDLANSEPEFLTGYHRVNEQFAVQLSPMLESDDTIWIHDFHLIPLAAQLRERGHNQKIGFFLHIPFPSPELITASPGYKDLISHFLSYDLIGFQTSRDLQNFRQAVADEMDFASDADAFSWNGRVTRTGRFPIGIDVDNFRKTAQLNEPDVRVRRLRQQMLNQALIIGVDRLDYSKGLPDRFGAYRRLLRQHPELHRNVTLMQIAPPTREDVGPYAYIRDELELLTGSINGEFADIDWTPVRYIHRAVPRNSLAPIYRSSHVGFVTPLRDGMNLVAKEFIAAQDDDDPGVLVLSKFAGAAEEMDEALIVNPYDVDEMAESLYRALHLPLEERVERQRALLKRIRDRDAHRWQASFLGALNA